MIRISWETIDDFVFLRDSGAIDKIVFFLVPAKECTKARSCTECKHEHLGLLISKVMLIDAIPRNKV